MSLPSQSFVLVLTTKQNSQEKYARKEKHPSEKQTHASENAGNTPKYA